MLKKAVQQGRSERGGEIVLFLTRPRPEPAETGSFPGSVR